MGRRKIKEPKPTLVKQPEKKEKPKKKPEETIAAAGGFLFAGGYVLATGEIPDTVGGWFKFVGIFVLVMMIVYIIAFNGKRIYLKKKAEKQGSEETVVKEFKKK